MKDAQGQLKSLSSKIAVISQRSDEIAAAIDEMLQYSYQYNVKILGRPIASERETPSETASLCLKLFSALGADDINLHEIDTAHRVPGRQPTNKPNSIICKFVRRLSKDRVMSLRREAFNLRPEDLGFNAELPSQIRMYDHLTPKTQDLLFQASNYKRANQYKFCWAKNGFVFLRKSESSPVVKLHSIENLRTLERNQRSAEDNDGGELALS